MRKFDCLSPLFVFYSSLNIVGCLLKRRPTKGGSRAPQDPPSYAPVLTSLGASISHFLIAAFFFDDFFSSSALNFVSFVFCLFGFFFVFRSSSFSVIGVSVVVVGGTAELTITRLPNFLACTGYHFFFYTRESFANTHSLLRKEVNY